jgi:hypothetical protein
MSNLDETHFAYDATLEHIHRLEAENAVRN